MLMGSGAGAAKEAVAALNNLGEKVGLLKLRLFRPFSADKHRRRSTPSRYSTVTDLARLRGLSTS